MASTALALPDGSGVLEAEVEAGHATLIVFRHPFRLDVRDPDVRVPAGSTIAECLKLAGTMPDWSGLRVRHKGRDVPLDEFGTAVVGLGDRLIVRAWPRDPITIMIAIGTTLAQIGTALAGSVGLGAVASTASIAGGFVGGAIGGTLGVGVGAIVGGLASFATGLAVVGGASYLVGLAARLVIGSPSSPGQGAGNKRMSPTASGSGNQTLPDHPVFITCGTVRVFPPHLAIAFQPGIVGGHDQDPSMRMLLGVAGDCIISDVRHGKTKIELLDAPYTKFRGQTTVNFPTAAVKRPGVTLRDEWDNNEGIDPATGEETWQVFSTDGECDEIGMVWAFQSGLHHVTDKGGRTRWLVSFDLEYRVAGDVSWVPWFAVDGAGNPGKWRKPAYVNAWQSLGANRIHVQGETAEPFFLYVERRNPRERYEIRARLRSEKRFFNENGGISNTVRDRGAWPRDRIGVPEGEIGKVSATNGSSLASDPILVQLVAYRDEPAVENFAPGVSGIDILLQDQTTKSDESARISFLCSRQIPELANGIRTAPTTTSNPVAICLDLMTGALAGDSALSDAEIDFPSWQAAHDYCAELVPTIGGGTEVRNRCDVVLDRDGVSRREQVDEIFRNCRIGMFRRDMKYHLAVDSEKTSIDIFSEAEVIEVESERAHTLIPDMLRVEFWNAEKDGDRDELHCYNDAPPVAGVLEHGGYAATTAEVGTAGTPVSVTCTRNSDYVTLARASGSWTFEDMPEEGWCCIRFPGGSPFADARLFLIDSVSADLLSLTVIDKAAAITNGTRNARFNTTAAQRIEKLSLPYSQRPSEVWREARYFHVQGRVRPEVHYVTVGTLDWLRAYQGAQVELQSNVPNFGLGSGRVLDIEGTLAACTGVKMDESFALPVSLTDPVIKFTTISGDNRNITRIDVHRANSLTKRSGTGDDRWLIFEATQDLSAIGFAYGDGNGSVGVFGEKTLESRSVVVQRILMNPRDLGGTLVCVDAAPTTFSTILDQEPVPRFQSGITETNIAEHARPAPPEVSVSEEGVGSPLSTIDASAVSGGTQDFTRSLSTWTADGFTTAHKFTVEGYANPLNNKVRVAASGAFPAPDTLRLVTAVGGVEAGTGNEHVRGVIGSVATTLSLQRSATGTTTLDVVYVSGSGASAIYEIQGPAASDVFAGFAANGILHLERMPNPENNGYWPVSSRPSDDAIRVTGAMLAASGVGNEYGAQSFVRRSSGDWATDALTVNRRVALEGFDQDLDGKVFTVRAATTSTLHLDDPFGLLETEAGDGDEMLTSMIVPVGYEVATNQDAGPELRVFVTVPLRPGVKSGAQVGELVARYRTRDRATGYVTSGWVPLEALPSGATSATFGPIPAASDWDFAAQHLSRDHRTPSDWMVITGNGPSDRPPAPESLQMHGDAVATSEGSEFAIRVEWAPPTATDVWAFLVRYRRGGDDGGYASQLLYDRTQAVILPARVGTYDVEVYTIAPNGQPSDALTGTFAFEPDRDFELSSVTGLRLTNPSSPATPNEFAGPDVFLTCVEPDYSTEPGADDPADLNAGIDPLVQAFEWQTFDPETGTVLRTERNLSRDYRYTRSMNAEDQAARFSRGPQRELGFRVRLVSKTNRLSQTDLITVANPRPPAPTSAALTSSPGNSTNGQLAQVHIAIVPGNAKTHADFRAFAVWADTTPGFTPGPSNFKGLAAQGDNRLSFPVTSDVTVYVRVGTLDAFHAEPELLTSPTSDVTLLAEQSITTLDAALFPVGSDDLENGAVTGLSADDGVHTGAFTGVQSLSTLSVAAGGRLAIDAAVTFARTASTPQIDASTLIRRTYRMGAVIYYNGSTYTDHTANLDEEGDPGAASQCAPLDADDALYLGNEFPFGHYNGSNDDHTINFAWTGVTSAGGHDFQYWNGSGWQLLTVSQDSLFGFTVSAGGDGTLRFTKPIDWVKTSINGSAELFFIRIIQDTPTQTGTVQLTNVFVQYTFWVVGVEASGSTSHVDALIHSALLSGTKPIENLELEATIVNPSNVEVSGWSWKLHAAKDGFD